MTQENKDLLVRDLCARLPYNVMIRYSAADGIYRKAELTASCLDYIQHMGGSGWKDCKPYLRPLSEMTDKEDMLLHLLSSIEGVDWLNSKHFDYRGLIGKGLALKAPKGMYN